MLNKDEIKELIKEGNRVWLVDDVFIKENSFTILMDIYAKRCETISKVSLVNDEIDTDFIYDGTFRKAMFAYIDPVTDKVTHLYIDNVENVERELGFHKKGRLTEPARLELYLKPIFEGFLDPIYNGSHILYEHHEINSYERRHRND